MIRRPPRSTRTDTLFPTRRSSDLLAGREVHDGGRNEEWRDLARSPFEKRFVLPLDHFEATDAAADVNTNAFGNFRSEEHTSELQSLMRISYAVFCLKKKKQVHIDRI